MSSPSFATEFPFGSTITLNKRVVTRQDDYNNDVYETTSTPVQNVPVWPADSFESVQGQDLLTSDRTAILPAGTDVSSVDSVSIDEIAYEIVGEPDRYKSPFTNTQLIQIRLRKVTG